MLVIRNLFNRKSNMTVVDEENVSERDSLLSTHTEHHMANPRVVSDIILVRSPRPPSKKKKPWSDIVRD